MDDLNKDKRVHNSKVHKENQQRPDFSMAEGSECFATQSHGHTLKVNRPIQKGDNDVRIMAIGLCLIYRHIE